MYGYRLGKYTCIRFTIQTIYWYLTFSQYYGKKMAPFLYPYKYLIILLRKMGIHHMLLLLYYKEGTFVDISSQII